MPVKRPTQADVAKLAGVSPSVVSAVLNPAGTNNVRVGEQTAARVWEVIRRIGYVPNLAARSLAQGRNNVIGVFTYEPVFPVSSGHFYRAFLEGIEEEAQRSGHNLLLFTGSDTSGRRVVYRDGLNQLQLADGAILLGLDEDKAELAQLVRDGFPFVFVGRRELADAEMSYVAADITGATAAMVDSLTDHGHRRLAFVHRDWHREPMLDRETGFRRATEAPEAPIEIARIVQLGDDVDYHRVVRALRQQGVTAILADDCDTAGRLCTAARDLDMSVPGDLSVAALSELHRGDWEHLHLTTVVTPRSEMGAEAVRLLATVMATRSVHRTVLACSIEPGDTVGPAPRTSRRA